MSEKKQLVVMGSGCSRCSELYEAAEQAARELGVPYEISKVSDLKQIMALGVMMTPALAVDGNLKVAGRVPTVEEIKKMLDAMPVRDQDVIGLDVAGRDGGGRVAAEEDLLPGIEAALGGFPEVVPQGEHTELGIGGEASPLGGIGLEVDGD